ncbi:MAG: hypothetical protein M3Q39_09505, partial [Actinomycetota bacterium]|nr:hypothetical protein [Actinomycetota bacterium]
SRGDDLDHLTVRLTNTAREAWVSDPEDRIEFVTWITDLETGELFPISHGRPTAVRRSRPGWQPEKPPTCAPASSR